MKLIKILFLALAVGLAAATTPAQNSDIDLGTRWTGQGPSHQTQTSAAQWLQFPFDLKLAVVVTNFYADTNACLVVNLGTQKLTFYGAGVNEYGQYIATNYLPVYCDTVMRRKYTLSMSCPNQGPNGSPLFQWGDMTESYDPDEYINTISNDMASSVSPVALSWYLWTNFTAADQLIFTNGDPAFDSERQTNLLVELNQIISTKTLYSPTRFADVSLAPDTTNLLAQAPTGQNLVYLNRLLLRDAFEFPNPDSPNVSGTAQVNLYVEPPTQLVISKHLPVPSYTVFANGPDTQENYDGSAQLNLFNPGTGYLSTNSAVIQIQKDKFGHFGQADGCDDPKPGPGVGKWMTMGPGCSADTNRIGFTWSVALGRTFDGLAAGQIALREEALTNSTFTPYDLFYNTPYTNVLSEAELVTTNTAVGICTNVTTGFITNGATVSWGNVTNISTNTDLVLRQIMCCQTFVDITAPNTNQTVLNFYLPGQIGAATNQYGIFTDISGDPFVTWTIQNPDPGTDNNLLIIETRGGISSTQSLTRAASAGNTLWTLTQGSGAATRVETREVSFDGSPTTNRVEVDTVQYDGGSPAYQCQETYHFYPWGPELVETSISDGSSNLVTSYSYYDNMNNPETYSVYGNGQLKQINYPDGYWEKRVYEDIGSFAEGRYYTDDALWTGYYNGYLRYVFHPYLDGTGGGTDDPDAAAPNNTQFTFYGYGDGTETFGDDDYVDGYLPLVPSDTLETTWDGIQQVITDTHQNESWIGYTGGFSWAWTYGSDLSLDGPVVVTLDASLLTDQNDSVSYGTAKSVYTDFAPVGLTGHPYITHNNLGANHPSKVFYYDHGVYDPLACVYTPDPTNCLYPLDAGTTSYPDHREFAVEYYGSNIQYPPSLADYYANFDGHVNNPGGGHGPPLGSSYPPFNNGFYGPLPFLHNETVRDIRVFHRGNLAQTETDVYAGTTNGGSYYITDQDPQWGVIYKSAYQVDSLGHVTNVISIDPVSMVTRTLYSANYRGTGGADGELLMSETDAMGATTNYTYDALKRIASLITVGHGTLGNISQQFSYDANGQILKQVTTGSSLTQTQSCFYDLDGRVTNQIDVAGIQTATTYGFGGRITTTTFPGGITKVNEKYPDRREKSVYGSGVIPEYYGYTNLNDPAGEFEPYSGEGGMVVRDRFTYKGYPNSPRWTENGTDAYGFEAWNERPAGGGTTNEIWELKNDFRDGWLAFDLHSSGLPGTAYTYDYAGRANVAQLIPYSDGAVALAQSLTFYGGRVDDVGGAAPLYLDRGRVGITNSSIVKIGSNYYRATTNLLCLDDGATNETVSGISLEQLNGFTAGQIAGRQSYDADTNETIATTYLDRENNVVTIVTSEPATSSLSATEVIQDGVRVSDSTISVASPTRYFYDGLGRTNKIQSPQGYFAYMTYDATTGWLTSQTNFTGQMTSYQYYGITETHAGMLKCETSANGKKTYYAYTPFGSLSQTWGDVPYPAQYTYNAYGDMTNLVTFRGGSGWTSSSWPSSPGIGDGTSWVFDDASGALLQKKDAQGNIVNYTYTSNTAQLLTRSWARTFSDTNDEIVSVTVTNNYDEFKELISQTYNDCTHGVNITNYNRAGKPREIIDSTGTNELTYDFANRLVSTAYVNGLLAGITISNHFNPAFGRDALKVFSTRGGGWSIQDDYGYDPNSGRLASVSNGSCSALYIYAANSDLLQSTTFKNGSSTVLTTRRDWDYGSRLRDVINSVNGGLVTSHTYQYDNVSRRTKVTLEDGSAWQYGYDDRNELISANRSWSYFATTTPVSGQQFTYGYDNIGNRQSAAYGGDTNGANLSTILYDTDSLNQYTNVITPSCQDIIGAALTTHTVTVNGALADRHAEYFHREIGVANINQPVWQSVTNISGTLTNWGGLVVPANSQDIAYDTDGNLIYDGVWNYQWDGENRLVSMIMTNLAGLATNSLGFETNRLRLDFIYDSLGRRIQKIVCEWDGSSFVPQSTNLFIYDGRNLIATLDPSIAMAQSFTWGNDLSGNSSDAGGVGGLLMATIANTNCFPAYDGNGNVTALINATDSTLAARYEYDSFGKLLRITGAISEQNPFRFSTKFWDRETGLIYYPSRYYSPNIGRWVGRDPAEENGGLNLFAFLNNAVCSTYDPLGRADVNAASVTGANALGQGMEVSMGAADNAIIGRADAAVEMVEVSIDAQGSGDAEEAAQVANDLKGMVVAIGRQVDTIAAKALNFGTINASGPFNLATNRLIMEALIKGRTAFYVASATLSKNYIDKGRITTFFDELTQLMEAGYKSTDGQNFLPPGSP